MGDTEAAEEESMDSILGIAVAISSAVKTGLLETRSAGADAEGMKRLRSFRGAMGGVVAEAARSAGGVAAPDRVPDGPETAPRRSLTQLFAKVVPSDAVVSSSSDVE